MGLKEEVIEMKKEVKEVKENSFAWEIVKDQEKDKKRYFIIILVIICLWFITTLAETCYIIYLLNDIGVEEKTTVSKTQEISDVDTIDDSNIVNGDYNG